ncbi:hypothetical protein B0H14DRAFT_3865995 [Mycena olivaceomarginata]|nr:hypothetical protein B0H14DRAFT_3865995 [Mycena olivaceomarginata]
MLTTASGLRTRLQHIDAEICQLENSLQSLREARTGVLNELRSLIYPVLSLPFEITSQIFLHCLPKRLEDSIRPYPSLDEAPLVFTRVCRDWRTVAISTSTLWNHVRIELDSDDGPGHIDSKWVALLDLWLQRSQPQPLSLTLSNWSYTEPDEALLGVLDRQSRRWRNITFKLPFNHFSRFEEHASLPLLERLTLSAHGSPDIINPILAFRHAPILRHLLELTPNIVSCVLDVQYDSHLVALRSPLMSLRTFTFSGPAAWGLLRYITMPALQTLDLSRCPLDSRNFTQVAQFVKRSACQLCALKIYVRGIFAGQTIHLLHLLPSLTALGLILAEAETGTAIFQEFIKSGHSSIMLPRVESISVHCMHDDNHELMFDVVTDALQIRNSDSEPSSDGPARVTSFTLSMDGDTQVPSLGIQRRWQELADEGMELRIGNSSARWI